MYVLSLFDGMSCGRIALDRAGIPVDKYYASEIDKWAMQISKKNYPDIIQLGDINNWNEWNIPWAEIELVTGGFPCQPWSVAGNQAGYRDERGALFWVMLDVIQKVLQENPRAKFLIENVKMKSEFEGYITQHVYLALRKIQKILINSALVSAQNRERYYWTNFEVNYPENKNIILQDVLECGVVDRDKSLCIDANYYKGGNLRLYFDKRRRQLVFCNHIANAININGLNCIKRIYSPDGKSPTLPTMGGGHREPKVLCDDELQYRKLTPLECERLQTVPDNYTEGVSNTQRYKMLGNGWTVDVIAHIFSEMKKGCGPPNLREGEMSKEEIEEVAEGIQKYFFGWRD